MVVMGWDLGGAHLKAARIEAGRVSGAASVACPLWQGLDKLDAAFAAARQNARFAICGMIEGYNTGSSHAFPYIIRLIAAKILMKRFIYTNYLPEMGDLYRDMGRWVGEGNVKSRETVRDGI